MRWPSPAEFRAALSAVPEDSRDAWLDETLGLVELPADDPALPRGCVPYLPCAVDLLLQMIEHAEIGPGDVFVDVGSGMGRALVLTHACSGATAIGVEIQPALVHASRSRLAALGLGHIEVIEGDAAEPTSALHAGSVFFLYCPFGGTRLQRLLAQLEVIARDHPIRVCCVDLPLPPCAWLTPVCSPPPGALVIYASVLGGTQRPTPTD